MRIILVVSANIQAHKPTDKQRMTAFLNNYVVEQERKEVEKQEHMNRNASTPEPVSAYAIVHCTCTCSRGQQLWHQQVGRMLIAD